MPATVFKFSRFFMIRLLFQTLGRHKHFLLQYSTVLFALNYALIFIISLLHLRVSRFADQRGEIHRTFKHVLGMRIEPLTEDKDEVVRFLLEHFRSNETVFSALRITPS